MKKIIILFLVCFCFIEVNAQESRGFGLGLSKWYSMDYKPEVANVELNYTISNFNDEFLIIPFVTHGRYFREVIDRNDGQVINRAYLWEMGSSFLQKFDDNIYLGIRISEKYAYNKYRSFDDKWTFDIGAEIQYDLYRAFGSILINSVYLHAGLHSFGFGLRF